MRLARLPALVGLALAVGCQVDAAPAPLRLTPPGSGPAVRFDPSRRALPDLPLPNDVATSADPSSRTGLRVDLSLASDTALGRRFREGLATMEGWGVSAPISVSFDRGAGADPREPAIDLAAVADRMHDDAHDPSDDPFYVVDLSTGLPVALDVESGAYPVVLPDPSRYGPTGGAPAGSNLLFETAEEGAGLPQAAYRPALDRDFDGVLDHPNTRARMRLGPGAIPGVDDLVTWYERESDTLVLRPLVPLEEKTEYAVVLTDRLRGPAGAPVRSPFEGIHHPQQRAGIARLRDWLSDRRLAGYYGDLAGTGLEHVAFAWTFTTQPTHEDLRVLRDGLYGTGPFARWQAAYPPELTAARLAGTASAPDAEPPGWEASSPACTERAGAPFVLRLGAPGAKDALSAFLAHVFGLDAGKRDALDASLAYVDHVVIGVFASPFLLGDEASRTTRTSVSLRTGEGAVDAGEVPFVLAVPKAHAAAAPPFPVALWGHGGGRSAVEALLHAGDLARQGVATIGYDQPGHGLVLDPDARRLALETLAPACAAPVVDALAPRRVRDLDGDGALDVASLWAPDVFHTRDAIRQGVVDGMNLVRVLRSFDGRAGAQDVTGDGEPEIAGDFDADGIPDVGGPKASYFTTGESLGGIVGAIQGAVDPHVVAAAPIAAGGGLASDVAFRSDALAGALAGSVLGPFVMAIPAGERPLRPEGDAAHAPTRCAPEQRSLRVWGAGAKGPREIEIACLDATELSANVTVVVTNVTSSVVRCARAGDDGRFAVPIPTSIGDRLDVQLYVAPDVVDSYATCKVNADAPVGRRIPGADEAPLYATSDGLGLRRQSPELRRFRDLAQAALDPADPVAFAPLYMLRPLAGIDGRRVPPRALLAIDTVGDTSMPVASNVALARAAGAVPYLAPSALGRTPAWADYASPPDLYEASGRRTPMQLLVDRGVVEGLARLGRTSAGPRCAANIDDGAPSTCAAAMPVDPRVCQAALYDVDWVSEGRLPFDAPHPASPLRLARSASVRASDGTSLAASWAPRLRGVPFGPDEAGWTATERVVALLGQYVAPAGAHGLGAGDTCARWDSATYGSALVARFFASSGQDIYYLSHPRTHACLADGTCAFLR